MRNENLHPIFDGIFKSHQNAVSAASVKAQYVNIANREIIEERLRLEMPHLLKVLDEFRAVVREFRDNGKLDYARLGSAFDDSELVVENIVERRKEPRR